MVSRENSNGSNNEISRRDFVKGAVAAVGFLLGINGCAEDESGETHKELEGSEDADAGGGNDYREELISQAGLTENTPSHQVLAGLQKGSLLCLSKPDISTIEKAPGLFEEKYVLPLVDYYVDPNIIGGVAGHSDPASTNRGFAIGTFYDHGQYGKGEEPYPVGHKEECAAGKLVIIPRQQVAQIRDSLDRGILATSGYAAQPGLYTTQRENSGTLPVKVIYSPVGKLVTSPVKEQSSFYYVTTLIKENGTLNYDLNFFIDPGDNKDYYFRLSTGRYFMKDIDVVDRWQDFKITLATIQGSEILQRSDERLKSLL